MVAGVPYPARWKKGGGQGHMAGAGVRIWYFIFFYHLQVKIDIVFLFARGMLRKLIQNDFVPFLFFLRGTRTMYVHQI